MTQMLPQTNGDSTRVMLTQMSQALQMMQHTIETLRGHEQRLGHIENLTAAHDLAVVDIRADVNILKDQMNSAIKVRSAEKKAIKKAVATVVYAQNPDKADRPQHFANVHCGLREYFNVSEYGDIPLSRFQEALKLLALYNGTGKFWWRE